MFNIKSKNIESESVSIWDTRKYYILTKIHFSGVKIVFSSITSKQHLESDHFSFFPQPIKFSSKKLAKQFMKDYGATTIETILPKEGKTYAQ